MQGVAHLFAPKAKVVRDVSRSRDTQRCGGELSQADQARPIVYVLLAKL
jgi:hypothetical protein